MTILFLFMAGAIYQGPLTKTSIYETLLEIRPPLQRSFNGSYLRKGYFKGDLKWGFC